MGKKKTRGSGMKLEFPKPNDSAGPSSSAKGQRREEGHAGSGTGPAGSGTMSSHGSKSDLLEIDREYDVEILIKKAVDLDTLMKAVTEWESLIKFRNDLREANTASNYDAFEEIRSSRKLDASLKKCTNFVKKVKTFTTSQLDQLEKEFLTLNLTKYLGEIASALTNAKLKFSDLHGAVILFSKFHQRYREFADLGLELFKKNLFFKKTDFNPSMLSKLTVDIRLFGELLLSGIFDKTEGFNLLQNVLKNMVMYDKEGMQMQWSSPMVSFTRGLGYDFAGIVPVHIKELCDQHSVTLPESNLIPKSMKIQMKSLLIEYYNNTCTVLLNSHEEVLTSELKNRRFLKTKGEIPEDRQSAHNEAVVKFDRHYQIVKKLSSYMNVGLPELRELPADPDADQASSLLNILNAEYGEGETVPGLRIFEDEETRAFYQDLPDMKVYLPQIVYRDNILKTAEETEAIAQREKDLENVDEDLEVALLNIESEEVEQDTTTESHDDVPPSEQLDEDKFDEVIKPSFQTFLDGLLNCVNGDMIDRAAKDFVDNFNTRSNRKKLTRTLFHIPRQRVDLLPLWARLVAVLAPVMPEIKLDLCQLLFKDFRYLVKKKDQIFVETKLKITRFIGELVNFGLFPKSDAFQCFKTLLMDFVHHQIEMACAFVETCGRYLHRNADSHRRMQIYLEQFMRKKSVKSLEPRYVFMVDNAYFHVCPPEGGPKKKKRPVLHAYIRYVIYDQLHRSNLEDSIKKMRALPWADEKIAAYFVRVMSQPWNLQFHQYSICASLLAALVPYQSNSTTRVVDNIIEGIYQKIGSVNVSFNQRRVSMIIYFGEFYNYRLVGSNEIFTILYALITHRVVLDHNIYNPFDPLDNLFRIRLVCTLLKTCGQYYNHGNSKKKLNCYLKYLQRYYWYKKSSAIWTEARAFPILIKEFLEDTIQMLRPAWKIPTSYDEACAEVADMENKLRKTYFQVDKEASDSLPQPHLVEELESDEQEVTASSPGVGSKDEKASVHMKNEGEQKANLEEEKITAENWEKFKPTDAELAEFDSQLERLCADTGGQRQAKTDIPVPIKTGSTAPDQARAPGTVDFVLLTRKGNKQNLKHIAIDEGTDFVKRITASKQAEERERLNIKQLTLGINRRQQEEEEFDALYNDMFKS